MCGINGVYNLSRMKQDYDIENIIVRMNKRLEHRGPDGSGKYINNVLGLGHTRLSIIDIEGGNQPIYNEDKSVVTVFNGEIYNHEKLRSELESKGHKFYTKSDTEVIVHLYEEYGEGFIEKLDGMFAIALWDYKQESLIIARDRFGKKPIYYYMDSEKLIFSSELKGILASGLVNKELNIDVLNNYFMYRFNPCEESLIYGIKKLLPAHYMVLKNGQKKIDNYWNLHQAKQQKDNGLEFYKATSEKLIIESIKKRMIADVPVGAFLSGGIDSSIIVAIMSKLSKQPINTFSLGFRDEGTFTYKHSELEYAKLVSEKYNTNHKEIILESKDVIDLITSIGKFMDEPLADPAILPTFLLSKYAREDVKVVLTGDGGDEIFGGYLSYQLAKLQEVYNWFTFPSARNVLKKLANSLPESTNRGMLNNFRKFKMLINILNEDINFTIGKCIDNSLREDLLTVEYFRDIDFLESQLLKNNENITFNDNLSKIMYWDIQTVLPNSFLMKVDSMTMANSLEGRSPFLDIDLANFMKDVPSKYKVDYKTTKKLLRSISEGYLPKELLNRKKHGFRVPLSPWFKTDLKDFVYSILLSENTKKMGLFNLEALETMLDRHVKGEEELSNQIWTILVFLLWYEEL